MATEEQREQVARLKADLKAVNSYLDASLESQKGLEDANAAQAAALRNVLWNISRLTATDTTAMDRLNCAVRMASSAAVNASIGEGWLPPGVREQAREALKGLMAGSLHGGADTRCLCPACVHGRAALDALKRRRCCR